MGNVAQIVFSTISVVRMCRAIAVRCGVCYVRNEGCHWGTPGWRTGRTIVAADAGSREAGGAVRRAVSDHRHHAFQLHQFGFAARIRSDAVQSAELEPAHSRGLVAMAGLGDYIEVLPPQMRVSQQWYQGTADAVYQNIYSIGSERSKYVFILSGDHIYKMNYSRMLQQHVGLRSGRNRRDD